MPGAVSRLEFKGVEGETDSILMQCFSPTSEYSRARETTSVVILGAKGTGKSAILRKIASDAGEEAGIVDLSPNEYLWSAIADFGEWRQSPRFAAKHAWTIHLLFGVVADALLRGVSFSKRAEVAQVLAGLHVEPGTWKTGSRQELNDSLNRGSVQILKDLKSPVDGFISLLTSCVGEILEARPSVLVFVDRLDLFWDNTAKSRRAAEGMLLSWKELTDRFPTLSVRISMRSDAYRMMRFVEHDKIQARIVELNWARDSLLKLLARRVSYCSDGTATDDAAILYKFFPDHVTGVRGAGGSQDTMSFILKLTHDRPRDLLNFCEMVKERTPAGSDSFPSSVIVRAEGAYSKQKRMGLEKEYSVLLPGLHLILQRLEGGRDRVTFSTLESRLRPIYEGLKYKFPDLCALLVEAGVLGVLAEDGERYFTDDPGVLTTARSRTTTFVVHRSLRSALRIVERREKTRAEDLVIQHRRVVDLRFQACQLCVRAGMEPVFKPTHKTELVASRPKVAIDENSFARFVGDMFQFIHESAGGATTRLPEAVKSASPVLEEVSRLRADLEHDIDHGDEGEVAKKRKRLGAICVKYIGKIQPDDEQDWMLLERSLYDQLLVFLERLVAFYKTLPPAKIP